jgi:hypothetical protein
VHGSVAELMRYQLATLHKFTLHCIVYISESNNFIDIFSGTVQLLFMHRKTPSDSNLGVQWHLVSR